MPKRIWATSFCLCGTPSYLAALAAVVAGSLALALSYSKRLQNTVSTRLSVGVAGLGYAIPGTIVAVGVIVPLAWLDHRMIDAVKQLTGHEVGLIFSGSIVALLFAYTVRFLCDFHLARSKTGWTRSSRSLMMRRGRSAGDQSK